MKVHNQKKIHLVQLGHNDIQGMIDLSASVGWDYDEHEIKTLLCSGTVFGHKTIEGKIVSSAAIITYDSKLASIGMVIVNKDFRGMGFAKTVTQKCIDTVSKDISIMLIATEEGKPVYQKLEFVSIDSVHKYLCDKYSTTKLVSSEDYKIEEYSDSHFKRVVELDGAAVGDKRSTFLQHRIKQSKESIVCKNQHGEIIGFGLSIQGPVHLVLGPIVAPNFEVATHLFHKLTYNNQRKLRIDIPSGKENFMRFVEEKGFTKVTNPPIMIKNSKQLPPRNNALYGISSQAYG